MDIEYPVRPDLGFVNWNWTVNCGSRGWKHVDSTRMPGYSQEQFQYDSFEQYSLQQLSDLTSETDQKVSYLQRELSTRNYNGKTRQEIQGRFRTVASRSEGHRQGAGTFKQAHPSEVIPESYHNFVQVLAHSTALCLA